ncbi:MAG: transposase [Bacteroidales bacterium]|nr:transposase [Bacteroidales bacterium]
MAQSLSKIYLHIIFHIKTTSPRIREVDLERVHAYIGQLVNEASCIHIWANGVEDHVHILCMLGREVTIAHLLEEVKRNSSRWIKNIDAYYHQFAWQSGYAAFSVSQSVVDKTLAYIKNQREHHKKRTFKDEYIDFLNLYNIEYDERYVFSD